MFDSILALYMIIDKTPHGLCRGKLLFCLPGFAHLFRMYRIILKCNLEPCHLILRSGLFSPSMANPNGIILWESSTNLST